MPTVFHVSGEGRGCPCAFDLRRITPMSTRFVKRVFPAGFRLCAGGPMGSCLVCASFQRPTEPSPFLHFFDGFAPPWRSKRSLIIAMRTWPSSLTTTPSMISEAVHESRVPAAAWPRPRTRTFSSRARRAANPYFGPDPLTWFQEEMQKVGDLHRRRYSLFDYVVTQRRTESSSLWHQAAM